MALRAKSREIADAALCGGRPIIKETGVTVVKLAIPA
jgi:uncharacterized protein (DUF433 family)